MRFRNVAWWRLAVWMGLLAVITIFLAAGLIASWLWFGSGLNKPDRIAAIGDTFAGGGLLLALVAGGVAILAYGVAIERPELRVSIDFPSLNTNPDDPVLIRMVPAEDSLLQLDVNAHSLHPIEGTKVADIGNEPFHCSVRVENVSDFTARNPVVRIELVGMWASSPPPIPWRFVPPLHTDSACAFRWAGGVDSSIHGHDTAQLPDLYFGTLFAADEGKHAIYVEALAEGYRRAVTIALRI